MVKLGIFVMLCKIAIATPVACGIAKSPREVEELFHEFSTNKLEQKVTKLRFYFQNSRGNTTGVVTQANGTATSPTFFGETFIADDPLTVSASQTSKVIGRAQGMYASASKEEFSLVFIINLIFTDPTYYNGSTLTFVSSNPTLQTKLELSVIRGTGVFRLARDVALLNTLFFDIAVGNTTVEYTVAVQHY